MYFAHSYIHSHECHRTNILQGNNILPYIPKFIHKPAFIYKKNWPIFHRNKPI